MKSQQGFLNKPRCVSASGGRDLHHLSVQRAFCLLVFLSNISLLQKTHLLLSSYIPLTDAAKSEKLVIQLSAGLFSFQPEAPFFIKTHAIYTELIVLFYFTDMFSWRKGKLNQQTELKNITQNWCCFSMCFLNQFE